MSTEISLETERLLLREVTVDDVTDRYVGWLNDDEVTRYLEARFSDNSAESLKAYVRDQLADSSVVFVAIVEKPDRLIGTTKIGPIDHNHMRADVGIMIGERDTWGQGYATETIRALSTFAFDHLGLVRLTASAYAVNTASVKAFKRAGFRVEGVLRGEARLDNGRVDIVQLGLLAPARAQDRSMAGDDAGTSKPGHPRVAVGAEPAQQRDAFLAGEGDEWFSRNPVVDEQPDRRDALIASYVDPSSSVLEIGCADGRRLAAISSLASAARYVGVDPSADAVETGKRRHPDLDLRVGTADSIPFDTEFELVILGFCLYLCDRELLPRIIAEVDRVLRDGGTLVITDFDPRYPRYRTYRHHPGLWSYKMDYAAPFLSFPSYSLVEKWSFSQHSEEWEPQEALRTAVNVLKKTLPGAYSEEPDE